MPPVSPSEADSAQLSAKSTDKNTTSPASPAAPSSSSAASKADVATNGRYSTLPFVLPVTGPAALERVARLRKAAQQAARENRSVPLPPSQYRYQYLYQNQSESPSQIDQQNPKQHQFQFKQTSNPHCVQESSTSTELWLARGRVWADRAHHATTLSLMGFTGLAFVVTAVTATQLIMYNRQKKAEWAAAAKTQASPAGTANDVGGEKQQQ